VTDQECLTMVWAIDHFEHYLGMKPFEVVTDHSALKWLQTCKMPKGHRARWIMHLQQYNFTIQHRPGKTNANADALSRLLPEEEEVQAQVFLVDLPASEEPILSETENRWDRNIPYVSNS